MKAATAEAFEAFISAQAFQSTPPVKAATLLKCCQPEPAEISIHAAHEGGDPRNVFVFDNVGISIHAAREGGDRCILLHRACATLFQSTPPVKAATYPI